MPPVEYRRIEKAIHFLEENFRRQPGLKEVARQVGLSEYHFHRLFSRWAGVSPKRFLQFLTADYARRLLRESANVLDAAHETGLTGPGRLHDLIVNVYAMTPGELKEEGAGLTIRFGVHPSPFGDCLVAVTDRGICAVSFLSAERGREKWERARKTVAPCHVQGKPGRDERRGKPDLRPFPMEERLPAFRDRPGNELSGQGVGGARPYSPRLRGFLRTGRIPDRGAGKRASRGLGHRPEPGGVPDPLPPRHPKDRGLRRIRLRIGEEKGDPRVGGRPFPRTARSSVRGSPTLRPAREAHTPEGGCPAGCRYMDRILFNNASTVGRSAGPTPTWCRRTVPPGSISTSPPRWKMSPPDFMIFFPLTISFR